MATKQKAVEIEIPYKFDVRDYQIPVFQAFEQGIKRFALVWHRRAGKDLTLINATLIQMLARVGTYYHFFPELSQGREAMWEGMDNSGRKFMDYFPNEIVRQRNKADMRITLTNGSIYKIMGADKKFDKKVGANPVGVIFSEWAIMDQMIWNLMSPMLGANDGWAAFPYTPRGRNHGMELWDNAEKDPTWFNSILTVDDTKDENGNPIISEEFIDSERARGVPEEIIQQEYYCSWGGFQEGSYYRELLDEAEASGRITSVPYEPSIPVNTAWDIGRDTTSVWFYQYVGKDIHFILYLEDSAKALPHYAGLVLSAFDTYRCHYFPHDMSQVSWTDGKARIDVAKKLGLRPLKIVQKLSKDDGIDRVRDLLQRAYFDKSGCEKGIQALYNYHHEYDSLLKEYKKDAAHDWSSHGADAIRTAAVADKRPTTISVPGYNQLNPIVPSIAIGGSTQYGWMA